MADGESPKGRRIEWIEGNPTDIETRGKQIVDLGDQMVGSAGVLKAVADGATGMEGLSVEKLKDVIGDVHEELKLAGERYSPTGHALTKYATSLEGVQTGLRSIVDDAEQYWQAYQGLPGYIDGQRPVVGMPSPGSPESTALAEDDREKQAAYDKWEDEAIAFDAKYDTWETAFEDATNSIGRATDGGISDSWKDDIAGFADVALDILAVAGIVLAVLAIIIGGPIIAILGAIVALATLALTLYMKAYGRADWGDVAWAVVGVLPIGKLGKFAEGGSEGMKAFLKGFVAADDFGKLSTAFRTGFSADGLVGLSRLTNGATEMWQLQRASPLSGGDILGRYMGFQNAGELAEAGTRSNGWADILSGHWDVNLKGTVANSVQLFDLLSGDEPPVDSWREQLAQNR
jgi:hypothetical protein